MQSCIGIIAQQNMEENFGELCNSRSVSMLPFGCRYRLVDFTISNMVNYGIKTVAIYTGKKIRSTMDHLGNGQPWDLNRRFQGLFLFPPVTSEDHTYKFGEIAEFLSTENFYNHTKEKYILFSRSNVLAKPNLDKAFEKFQENDSDITLFYYKVKDENREYLNVDKLHLDEEGKLINIGMNLGTEVEFNMYLGMFFIKKETFIDLIKTTVERGNATSIENAININRDNLNISTFEYKGIMENIRDIRSYYQANLKLNDEDFYDKLFLIDGKVFTKTKDEPSTLYLSDAQVYNSTIANGCIINGEVEDSVVFRGVTIEKGAIVKNSIIMQKSHIKSDAIIVNSILDKNVVIDSGVTIAGNKAQPYIVAKNQRVKGD